MPIGLCRRRRRRARSIIRLYKPKAGDRYLARANGVTTDISGNTLPLYTARLDQPQLIWFAELYEDVDAGTYAQPSGPYTAKLFVTDSAPTWTDTGLILSRIYNTQQAFSSGTRVVLYYDIDANLFHILGTASVGAAIRVAKLRESLYPCTDPATPEGPVLADVYTCTLNGGGDPIFQPTVPEETVELWNVTANYYQKFTFVRFDQDQQCGVAMVTEGWHPGVFKGVLSSPLPADGTSNAVLLGGEPMVDVADPFNHPIDAILLCALVYDAVEGTWYSVQSEMTVSEMVCAVTCNPSLAVSYRDLRFDYAIEPCPAPAPTPGSTAEDGGGISLDVLSVAFPPEILEEYIDVSVLAAVYTNPAVPGLIGGGGYSFGTANPIGP